jgi:hypothetical protein
MKETVDRLLAACPGAEPVYFEVSAWFDDDARDQVESVIKEFGKHYSRRLKELKAALGNPDQTEKTHRAEIESWYPEAIRATCWIREGKTLCLALEQHDQETPVGVLLRCVSADEIAELSS